MPSDVILEGLYKSKLQDSCQHQTVLDLYDQELFRNTGQPNYSRLQATEKLHIDQMMRTRYFSVGVERGSVTRSKKKERKPTLRGKWENYFHWKAQRKCSKGDACSFRHDLAFGNSGGGQRLRGRSSSPAPNSKAKQTDGEAGNKEESSDRRSQIVCRYWKCQKTNRVSSGIFPCVRSQVWKVCTYGDKCCWGHVETEGKSSNKSKRGGAKGSVAILKESTQLGCVSRDSYPRKSFLCEPGKLGSKRAVKFSKSTRHQNKIRERMGPSRGIIQKCAPHWCNPCPPKFGESSHEETLHQEGCARKAAWDLSKHIYKLKNSDKATFCIPNWSKGNAGTYFKKTRGARIRSPFRSINAHDEQKKSKAQKSWPRCEGPETQLWHLLLIGKCIQTRRHKCSFTI